MTPNNDKVDQSGADEREKFESFAKEIGLIYDAHGVRSESTVLELCWDTWNAALKAQTAQAVAHQFYQGGAWHNFLNERHHLETVKAGYPIRALYAAPQQAVAASNPIKGCSVCYGTGIDVAGNACAFNCKPLASINQPVQDRASDKEILAMATRFGFFSTIEMEKHFRKGWPDASKRIIAFSRALLASQPSAQADAAAVRDDDGLDSRNYVEDQLSGEEIAAYYKTRFGVEAVRDAALEEAAQVCSDIARKYIEHKKRSTYEPLGLDASGCAYAIRALKSAAPTAQPQDNK